jgi:hypothetical protein
MQGSPLLCEKVPRREENLCGVPDSFPGPAPRARGVPRLTIHLICRIPSHPVKFRPMPVGQDTFDARFAAELNALKEMGVPMAVVEGTFVHEPLGIAFTSPPGWTLRELREVQEFVEGRLINSRDDIFSKAFNEVMREISARDLPVMVLAAPPLDDPIGWLGPHEIAPLISILREEEVDPAAESDFDLLASVNEGRVLSRISLEDYRLLRSPERTTLSGYEAVTYSAAYTALHVDAVGGCPFRERAYVFRRGPAIYSIRMGDYPDRDPRLAFDYTGVIDSICLR